MARRPGKHLPYFTVVEALSQPGCFLCTLVAGETRRYLRRILDEFVNDAGFRKVWRGSRGFCHRHSWMMADAPEALGMGILYLDLLDLYGEDLLTTGPGKSCPVCAQEEEQIRAHLDTLVKHWAEPELRGALSGSEGLCGPHLRRAMAIMRPGEPRNALRKVSLQNTELLKSQLSQLVESFDYRHERPKDEAVRRAWLRAMEKLVGVRELKGG